VDVHVDDPALGNDRVLEGHEREELDDRQRTELIAGMRVFLEACPACDGSLDPVEDVRQTCCAGEIVSVSVDCPDCGARIFSGSHA
jgi:C4-type Zn-finger protein